jgi:spore coat protein A, manganese oxidase
MSGLTRRRFLRYGLGAGAALAAPWPVARAAPAVMGVSLRKYVDRLPVPGDGIVIARPRTANAYAFTQRQISRMLHRDLPATPLWAYDDGSGLAGQAGSFGMAIVATSGTPLDVRFTNRLPPRYPRWIPVDARLTPFRTASGAPQVRLMTHLHGGFVAAGSDGNPAATPELFAAGQTQSVHYPNDSTHQPASLLWFHDHGLGTTRLHVFAGLAGAYLLRDDHDTGEDGNVNGLPSGRYEIPLVIQDRQFSADGKFLYPTSDIPGVTWIGEYFGDVMLVNGKVWPYLDVEPRLYRFRVLNGCNARILNVDFGSARIWQIGAEGGMWDKPVPVNRLVLAPAERADVLVDFSKLAGYRLAMGNATPSPPVSSPAPDLPTVMQFRVARTAPATPVIPTRLCGGRKADLAAPPPSKRRFITLNEADVDTPEWELTLNGTGFDDAAATETPTVGTTEDWYYINLTGDTHPMHMHLVTFQVVGRVPFDADRYAEDHELEGAQGVPGGIDPTSYATGPMMPPDRTERGFKDTVKVNPGTFTIIRAKFDLPTHVTAPQSYVHHCHIVEHEDNDMMRPFTVMP